MEPTLSSVTLSKKVRTDTRNLYVMELVKSGEVKVCFVRTDTRNLYVMELQKEK
ncbi:Uncharacterized protein dnm_041860 [Desulfonema magnum]|uniref:Uncharacterized protein n=1 Tax=Desulfonema magnum TaxID=45655 RepID=A0A975BME8_9BACT|nr:Uncharacterized protein dnm_041860 [Desulfonema magnum]